MLIYLHGFNSSPQSTKAQQLRQYLAAEGLESHYRCPALPHRPREAVQVVEALIAGAGEDVCFVGSSLGGFYATWLADRHGSRAVLLNPAIEPHAGLREYLGDQQNLYTGERYELTAQHLQEWRELYVPQIEPSRYLLLVETGDEVLDYRQAMVRYAGARQIIVEGGDHTLKCFREYLPRIVRFAQIGR